MSHFSVIVIGDDIEKQLQPYHEYECTGRLDQYVKFVDLTDEVVAEFESDTHTRIRLPNGQLKKTSDKMFYRPATPEELKKIGLPIGSGVAGGIIFNTEYRDGKPKVTVQDHSGLEEVEVPVRELYADVKEYAEKFHGYDIHAQTGRIGRMTNPDARWDWWQVGGRWTGFFKGRDGVEGVVGEEGLMTEPARPGYFDSLLKGEIDFEAMRAEAAEKAHADYDKYERVTEGIKPPERTWAELRDSIKDISEARETYRSHPWVQALLKAHIEPFVDCSHDHFCVRTGGRETFVRRAENFVAVPYAVVQDGKWAERGKMGLFGIAKGEISKDEWAERVRDLLEGLPDDVQLTVVDCHI